MDIVFITDENYFRYMLTAIITLQKNVSKQVVIHCIVTFKLEAKEEMLVENLKNSKTIINIMEFDNTKLKKIKTKGHVSNSAYIKILLPQIFSEKDKVLFLDSDVIVIDDITKLMNRNMENYTLCAVEDPNYDFDNKVLGIKKSEKTFNSGVMIMNLKKMREDNSVEELKQFIETKNHLTKLNDQAAFNFIFKNKWKNIDQRWNVIDTYFWKNHDLDVDQLNQLFTNPGVVHFTGTIKPWHRESPHPYTQEFLKAFAKANRYALKKSPLNIRNKFKMVIWKIQYYRKKKLIEKK